MPHKPAPATEQEWLGNATGQTATAPTPETDTEEPTATALDLRAEELLFEAYVHQCNGDRTSALAATQSALIALAAADAVAAGRGVAE